MVTEGVSAMQPKNALRPILVTLLGMVIEANNTQLSNIYCGIVVSEVPKDAETNFEQKRKCASPDRDVRVLGKDIEVNFEQLSNA